MRLRNIPGAQENIDASSYTVTEPAEFRGAWKEKIFGNDHPIHLEVGMGKGRFLMDLARLHPEINYVGIEMYSSVLLRAVQKAESLETPFANVRFLCVDARELPLFFAQGEAEKIYLNFSDPWPKDRHAKRRLTSRQFLARYEQILPEGGIVEFKTDNTDLFDFSLEEQKEKGWELLACTRDLHADPVLNEGNIMTEYEERFSSQGNKICKMVMKPARK